MIDPKGGRKEGIKEQRADRTIEIKYANYINNYIKCG
jgi:hypothetical protein